MVMKNWILKTTLSTYSVILMLMVGAPVWSQEIGETSAQDTRAQEQSGQESTLRKQEEIKAREADRAQMDQAQAAVVSFSVPFTAVRQVAVECNGNCNDSTLGTLCQSGWTPIAVDCQNVQEWTGGACGGDNRCARFTVRATDPLSFYCDDISGWDANVYCAQ